MATVTSKGTVRPHRSPVVWLAGGLVIIGALNWGLVGLLQFDLVAALLGAGSTAARTVYVLVAIGGVYLLIRAFVPAKNQPLARH